MFMKHPTPGGYEMIFSLNSHLQKYPFIHIVRAFILFAYFYIMAEMAIYRLIERVTLFIIYRIWAKIMYYALRILIPLVYLANREKIKSPSADRKR